MFSDFSKKRAIKQYAEQLPGFLKNSYGGSGHSGYTEGQVTTAVNKLNLNPDYLSYAFLIFCGEEVLLGQGETSESIEIMSQYLATIGSGGGTSVAASSAVWGFFGAAFFDGSSDGGDGGGGGGGDG